MCACQEIPPTVKVKTRLRPIHIMIACSWPRTFSATTASAPISPKIAPEAPRLWLCGSANSITAAEPAIPETRYNARKRARPRTCSSIGPRKYSASMLKPMCSNISWVNTEVRICHQAPSETPLTTTTPPSPVR